MRRSTWQTKVADAEFDRLSTCRQQLLRIDECSLKMCPASEMRTAPNAPTQLPNELTTKKRTAGMTMPSAECPVCKIRACQER